MGRKVSYPMPLMSLDELKSVVLNKAAIQRLNHLRFLKLAELIQEHTGKRISVTTLKRVYGHAERKHQLSGYTISVLAEYGQAITLKKTG